MYNDQDRPPWLRNLRPPRPEPEEELYPPPAARAEPRDETRDEEAEEAETGERGTISRGQLLFLAILLWANVSVLGCLCLLATQVVQP
jgi:hypothetical protein